MGFGGASIANLFTSVTDDEAHAAVQAAWDAGIRFFDTAPHYGLGLGKRRLGAALRTLPREEYVVTTKVGRVLEPLPAQGRDTQGFDVPADARRVWDFSADGFRRSLEASLDRLGLDRVDVVLIHDPDEHEDAAFSEAYPALERLRGEGVVRAIGAGMNQSAMLTRFVRETDVDLVLWAGRYTVLDRSAASDLLPAAQDREVPVIAAGVYNSGLLASERPANGMTYDYAAAPAGVVERAQRLARVCERHGVPLPTAALQFPLRHPAVASVLVGMRTADEVTRNTAALEQPLPDALWDDLAPLP